jgi:hypothetical protein
MTRQKFTDHVFAIPPCKELLGRASSPKAVSLSGIDLTNCTIDGGHVTSWKTTNRSVVKNVRIKNSKIYAFSGQGVVFEQVTVDGLQTGPKTPMFFRACVFRHTTFKGDVGQVMFNPIWNIFADEEQKQAFLDANADYYKKKRVDWAIDISEMEAACFEINGAVPSHLVRRNSLDQFVLQQEDAVSGKWKKVPGVRSTAIPIRISQFLSTGMPDTVLVAHRRSKSYGEELAVYQRMRDAGFLT